MSEKYKCKHCDHPVTQNNGEWWHVSTYGENDGVGNMLPSLSLRKLSYLGSHTEKCGSCGHEKTVDEYCRNPEPEATA